MGKATHRKEGNRLKILTSYSVRISPAAGAEHSVTKSELHKALADTVRVYRKAVDFFSDIVLGHWDAIGPLDNAKDRLSGVEMLTIATKTRPEVETPFGEGEFYKYPALYRRAAINKATGRVSSYKSNLANWEESPKGKKPRLGGCGYEYPTLYRGGSYREGVGYTCEIKLFIHNTWDWVTVKLRKGDIDYINRHCGTRRKLCPALRKRGKVWSLDFTFEENIKLADADISDRTILAVDLGINNAATVVAMRTDGTILGRHVLKLPKEEDSLLHAVNRTKKAQQHGAKKMPRLWARAKGINDDITSKTAEFIMYQAAYYNVDVIVFEHLDLNGKKRHSKRQRTHLWKARAVQRIVTDKAHRMEMRISRVCAWGTSRLAYDGSGRVERGVNGNYSICRFKSGKIYNCDLSASYNIGARYIIREIVKSLSETARLALEAKVPQIAKRSTCTYSTLISLVAELEELVLPADSKSAVEAAA